MRRMDREPHRRRLGLRCLHAMTDVRGDLDPIAGLHVDGDVTLFESQAGGAGKQHDELIVGLVVIVIVVVDQLLLKKRT